MSNTNKRNRNLCRNIDGPDINYNEMGNKFNLNVRYVDNACGDNCCYMLSRSSIYRIMSRYYNNISLKTFYKIDGKTITLA